jgi:hypothetical protein
MAIFGGPKPDHPMADPKQARLLIADINQNDAAAIEEITFWLDSVSRTEEFKPEYRYELYDALDQAAKLHQRRLAQEYLVTDRLEKFRENKLWSAISGFWKALGDSYAQCIAGAQSGDGGLKKDLPVIIARLLRVLALQLKWSALRYGPVDESVWAKLGELYLVAESGGTAATALEIYPGAHGQGTVEHEFAKALMLGVSATDSLAPKKQEIAERVVAHFGTLYTVASARAPDCNFYFDLAAHKPPARIIKEAPAGPAIRYFGAGKALPVLQQLMEDIKANHGLPAEINLGGTYESGLVLSVLEHLATYWSDKPPARASIRRKIATRLTVVHGFEEILRAINVPEDNSSLDFLESQSGGGGESWIVENVSDGGFGAIVPQVKADWIKVGSLLAVRSETAVFWGAGVLRRVSRDEYQQRRVGIQLISKAVIPVALSPAESGSSQKSRDAIPGVLLSTTPDKDGNVSLLMKIGSYTPSKPLEMNVRGKTYLLLPRKLVEGGDDFDLATFKPMKKT